MSAATIVLFAIFFLLLLSTAPIAVAMGLTAFIYVFLFTTQSLTQLSDNLFNSINSFPLMAIPFFVLAANIMAQGGISRRIIASANAIVGHFRGGLAMTAVLSCIFFAAISGSSPATVVAVGTLMMPAMAKAGYGERFSTGILATSGSLGILLPPSIALIVYGITVEESIGDLFLAGVLPGLLGGFMILGLVAIMARRRNFSAVELVQMSNRERLNAFYTAFLSLLLPVFVLGGIYGGFFTPTEAAAMAVLYALIVSLVVYREIKPRDLIGITIRSARTSAMILFIIANAILFSFVLASERIPGQVTALIVDLDFSMWGFLLTLNILLLVVGAFIDTISALVILAPIVLPVALELGVDPIHLGIIMVMNLEIGLITPPLGVNLFVASGMSGLPALQVARGAIPSALVLLLALFLVTFIPAIALAFLAR